MDKQDWVDIFRVFSDKDVFDYVTLVVEIASPVLLLISIIISFKAAKASRDSVKLNQQVYEDQKRERELSFIPLFRVMRYSNSVSKIRFEIKNKNEREIHLHNVVGEKPQKVQFEEIDNNLYFLEISGSEKYENGVFINIWLYYKTLDHKNYCAELILHIFNGTLVIKEQEHEKREESVLVPQA